MQNVSEEFKTAIASPSPEYESRMTFPDLILDDVQVKSIELNSVLTSGNDFEIGTAPMDMVKIELVYDMDVPITYDFENQECDTELGIKTITPNTSTHLELNNYTHLKLSERTHSDMNMRSIEYVSLGLYTVEKAIKKNNVITLDCVDRMYKAEKDYVSDLLYPTTLLDILQSACDQAGIELVTTTFANRDYIVPNEPAFEGITCRKVFAQIAELAGGYAKINRLGQLEILTLGIEPVRDIDNFKFTINEVAEASIEKVVVKVGEETATKGEGKNIYTIVDNMFVQDPNNVIDALYDVLKNVNYISYHLPRWQGDFSLDLGDKVTVDGYETYVLDRKLKYTGGLREDYSAPAKSNVEKESTGKGSLTLDIESVKTQIKVIDGEITQKIEQVEGRIPNEVAEQLKNAEIYTWIKYADDEHGNGMSDNPAGKKYVGIAVNKKNIEPSNNPSDYEWSRVQGEQGAPGKDGKDGEKGEDGQTTYTWIKYADDKFGNGMSDDPDDKRYVGIATNKTTPNKSTNPADYEWSPLYDNVEIGGENRLFDSRTNIEFYSNHALDIRLVRGPSKPYYRAFNPSGSNINLFAAFPNSRFAEPLESLGRVTVSLDVMVDVDRDVTINGATFPVKGNRWTKIHFSKTFEENTTKHRRVRNPFSRKWTRDINVGTKLIDSLSTNINTLYYRNLQVEKGNVPTDHNLTPEELEGSITRTSSEIKQLSDSISLIAKRNENTGRFEVTPESIVLAIDGIGGVGKIKNVNATLDEHGFTVENGALIVKNANNVTIITADGLRVMYIFTSSGELEGWQRVGIWDIGGSVIRYPCTLNVHIPDDLIIDTATLYTRSMPAYRTGDPNIPNGFYHPRNLRLYKGNIADDGFLDYPADSEFFVWFGADGRSDITANAWGSPWTPSGKGIKEKLGDVTNYLTPGESNNFIVETTDSETYANSRYMGAMQLELVIQGYLRG